MVSKKSSILLTILVFYSTLGVCENSNYHFSVAGGYDMGGDILVGDISANSGFFLDIGAVYDLRKMNRVSVSYGVKTSALSSSPSDFDFSKDPISTNSNNIYRLRSNYVKILGYHKFDQFAAGIGVSYHHRAFLECNNSTICVSNQKFKNGFGYHIEIVKVLNDAFHLSELNIGASYTKREYETDNGLRYDSNGFGLFIRFTTV